MIVFPNAKINIGLNITGKRLDGYHNLETIFYPVGLSDILEFVEFDSPTRLNVSGLNIHTSEEDNLVLKAYRILKKQYHLPELNIFLHKMIPTGAGLGGGSSDASFFVKALNEYFELGINQEQLEQYVQKLGSDCPFFINNKTVFARGTGNIFSEIELDLSGYQIVIVKPEIHINTKSAFQNIKFKTPENSLKELVKLPVEEWKKYIVNDFESYCFKQFPEILVMKSRLYSLGALYAQMSGSGSAVFGIFKTKPEIPTEFNHYFVYTGI